MTKYIDGKPIIENDLEIYLKANRSTPQARFWKVEEVKPKPHIRKGEIVYWESRNRVVNTLTGKKIYRSQSALNREFTKSIHEDTEKYMRVEKRLSKTGKEYYVDLRKGRIISNKKGSEIEKQDDKKRKESLAIQRYNEKRLIKGNYNEMITKKSDNRVSDLSRLSKLSKSGKSLQKREMKIRNELQTKKMNRKQKERLEEELNKIKLRKKSYRKEIVKQILPNLGS